MELAAGLFALALVVSALCLFATYIVQSLKVQNSLRSVSPQPNVAVRVDDFAERFFVFKHTLPMNESAVFPSLDVPK